MGSLGGGTSSSSSSSSSSSESSSSSSSSSSSISLPSGLPVASAINLPVQPPTSLTTEIKPGKLSLQLQRTGAASLQVRHGCVQCEELWKGLFMPQCPAVGWRPGDRSRKLSYRSSLADVCRTNLRLHHDLLLWLQPLLLLVLHPHRLPHQLPHAPALLKTFPEALLVHCHLGRGL